MKKMFLTLFSIYLSSSLFAIGGFGLNFNSDLVSISDSKLSKNMDGIIANINTKGFDNLYGMGGFLYIDIIPFADLELDFQFTGNTYKFNIDTKTAAGSEVKSLPEQDFVWLRGSGYLTVRKDIIDLSLPVLGGVSWYAGGGLNTHSYSPFITLDLLGSIVGDDLYSGSGFDTDSDEIIKKLKDKAKTTNGVHVQSGIQFKVLTFVGTLNFRYTIVEDLYPDISSFPSANFNIGFGI
tara:strand:- start:531 stop:1241 length:711 start_codon:yes stop_codon:yes gene_type:complete